MFRFTKSAAVRLFDEVFFKYVALCTRICGQDLEKTKFVNFLTFSYIFFLSLGTFASIYTSFSDYMMDQLFGLLSIGAASQVSMDTDFVTAFGHLIS